MKKNTATVLLAVIAALAFPPAMAAELVVIVNPKNQAMRMFSEQASQFFLGKSTVFTPVEFIEGNTLRTEFTQKVLGKEPAQVKAIWAKLVFTGKAVAPREYASNAEVKRAVAADATPSAISTRARSTIA